MIAAVLGGLWTVNVYLDQRRSSLAAQQSAVAGQEEERRKEILILRRESQKPFFDKQLSYYFEATRVAAQLATLAGGREWDQAAQRFWELYLGELIIVESPDVAAAMVNFGKELTALSACVDDCIARRQGLRALGMEIGQQARRSVEASWEVSLGEISGAKN